MVIYKKLIPIIASLCIINSAFGADQRGVWNRFSSWLGSTWLGSYFAPQRYNYLDARTKYANRLYKYGLGGLKSGYKPAAVAQELVNEEYADAYVPKIEIEEMTPNISRYPYINTLKYRLFAPVTMKGLRTYQPTPIQGIPASELVKVENEATAPFTTFDAAVVNTRNKMEEDMLMRASQQVERNRENMRKVRRSFDEGYLDAGSQLQECLTEGPGDIGSCGLQAAEFNDFIRLKQDTNRRFNALEQQNNQTGYAIKRRLDALEQRKKTGQ